MGDFKDLYGYFIQMGCRATVDPQDDFDAVLISPEACQSVPFTFTKPTVVKLSHRLSDFNMKRRFAGARFAYSNEEIMHQLADIKIENNQGRQIND